MVSSSPFRYHHHYSRSPSSFPHPDGHIRADFTADGTSGAGLLVFPDRTEIPLTVHLFADPDQLFRAGDRAESTPFAPLSINLNLCHHTTVRKNLASESQGKPLSTGNIKTKINTFRLEKTGSATVSTLRSDHVGQIAPARFLL